jgi:ketosteroid isomerase-like protein
VSQENVDLVRHAYEASLRGDFAASLAKWHPDVEIDGRNLPDGGVYRGHDGLLEHVTRWADMWEDWRVELDRFIDAGDDRVVVLTHERGRNKATGMELDALHAELYTVRDAQIVRWQGFSVRAEALEAVGLRE